MRALLVVLSLAFSPAALAVEPADVVGAWITETANQGGAAPSGATPMQISLDSPDALDGVSPSPGPDATIYGEAVRQADGTLFWSGTWANVWPEGVTRGTFRFVFTDANSFTGTWSSDDGEIKNAAWNGRRVR